MPEFRTGPGHQMEMENGKHDREKPAPSIWPSPGKPKQLYGRYQRRQSPSNGESGIEGLDIREPDIVKNDEDQRRAEHEAGGKDQAFVICVQQNGAGK